MKAAVVWRRLFGRGRPETEARALYLAVVAQARRPEFYGRWGVPDTLDGRFDLIALHAFLVLHRLKRDRPATADLAQALFDTMFLDMDRSLREMGAGDLGVGRRVKAMARGFYGRVAAYEAGLAGVDAALESALRRNLYGTAEPTPSQLAAMAAYLRREASALAGQETTALAGGEIRFGPPPAAAVDGAGESR